MMDFRCVRCGTLMHADERHGGRFVKCGGCARVNVCPFPAATTKPTLADSGPRFAPRSPGTKRIVTGLVLVSAALAIGLWIGRESGRQSAAATMPDAAGTAGPTQVTSQATSPSSGQEWMRTKPTSSPVLVTSVPSNPVPAADAPVGPSRQPAAKPTTRATRTRPSATESLEQQRVWAEIDAILSAGAQPSTTEATPLPLASLPTGTQWGAATEQGLGSLHIENGTKHDALAALFDPADEAQRAIYVRAGDSADLLNIASGTYALRFSLGLDWDETARAFRRGAGLSEFVKLLQFTETQTDDAIVYKTSRVTLHVVRDGNAPIRKIQQVQFDLSKLVRVPVGVK